MQDYCWKSNKWKGQKVKYPLVTLVTANKAVYLILSWHQGSTGKNKHTSSNTHAHPLTLTHVHQFGVSHGDASVLISVWLREDGKRLWMLRRAAWPLQIISQLRPLLSCCGVIPHYLLTLRRFCVHIHCSLMGHTKHTHTHTKINNTTNKHLFSCAHWSWWTDKPFFFSIRFIKCSTKLTCPLVSFPHHYNRTLRL